MRRAFVESILDEMIEDDQLEREAALLAVCAGSAERDVFARLGFSDVVLSNLDVRMNAEQVEPFAWSRQDAQNLTYEDQAFDYVFVADGLHHCASPHRALLEMYRVARHGVIVVESRDSLVMRLANRLGLSPEYELEAVIDHGFKFGGVDNTHVPNFIYRWTEDEFKKTVRSFNPTGRHAFRFFYGLNLPYDAATFKKRQFKHYALLVADPVLKLFTRLFKKQCNSFAMVALKPQGSADLWPWLKQDGDDLVFDQEYAARHFRVER